MTDPGPPIIPGRSEPPQLPPGHPLEAQQPYAQQVYVPPPTAKKTPVWVWILIPVGAAVLVGVVCCGLFLLGVGKAANEQAGAAGDVSVTLCTSTSYGSPKAFLHVANSTDTSHDYWVTVAFESGNAQLDTGTAVVNDLGAGQVADVDAIGFSAKNATGFTCRVTKVTRL